MTEQSSYYIAGSVLSTPYPLHAPTRTGPPDLTIEHAGEREVPFYRPEGLIVAELVLPDGPRYTFTAGEDGYAGRFYGSMDLQIDAELTRASCWLSPDLDPRIAGLLTAGTVLSFVLMKRGSLVLHASAVVRGESTLAIVGQSGRGKSTVAALLASAGHAPVTDDILRVERGAGGRWRCLPAMSELRLRPKARGIAERLTGSARDTVDNRLAVDAGQVDADELPPLGAIVVPFPEPGLARVTGERVSAARASAHIMTFTRVEGWNQPEDLTRLFKQAAEVAATVPVIELRIPWGPPFPESLGGEITDVLEQALVSAGGRSPR